MTDDERMLRSQPKCLVFSRRTLHPILGAGISDPSAAGVNMITLCIRYTLDAAKLADFEAYARALRRPVERCGGKSFVYYLPTKIAGPTNTALGLIDFPDLGSYERYRERLSSDPAGIECRSRVEAAGCILNEDRSFVRRVPDQDRHPDHA